MMAILARRVPLTMFRCLAVLSFLLVTSCGDDTSDKDPAAKGVYEGPLYLIATEVSAGDLSQVYAVLSPTFDETTSIDPTGGFELQGKPAPIAHGGAVYVPDTLAPRFTRYTVSADRQLVPGLTLSFDGLGLQEVSGYFTYFVSDEKAYLYDPANLRIIVWNPKTMELSGKEIALPELALAGYTPNLWLEDFNVKMRGDQLLIPVSWTDQDYHFSYGSALLVLNTITDEIVRFSKDGRCSDSYISVELPSGDIYYFSQSDSSAQFHFAEGATRPSCTLRVLAGQDTFDPDFVLDLSPLVSNRAVAGGIPDGSTGFFFTAADEARWADREANGYAVWSLWHYDLETKEARPIDALRWWAGSTYHYRIGGEVYLPFWEKTADGSYETTIYRMSGTTEPSPLFSFHANWRQLAQIQK